MSLAKSEERCEWFILIRTRELRFSESNLYQHYENSDVRLLNESDNIINSTHAHQKKNYISDCSVLVENSMA